MVGGEEVVTGTARIELRTGDGDDDVEDQRQRRERA